MIKFKVNFDFADPEKNVQSTKRPTSLFVLRYILYYQTTAEHFKTTKLKVRKKCCNNSFNQGTIWYEFCLKFFQRTA